MLPAIPAKDAAKTSETMEKLANHLIKIRRTVPNVFKTQEAWMQPVAFGVLPLQLLENLCQQQVDAYEYVIERVEAANGLAGYDTLNRATKDRFRADAEAYHNNDASAMELVVGYVPIGSIIINTVAKTLLSSDLGRNAESYLAKFKTVPKNDISALHTTITEAVQSMDELKIARWSSGDLFNAIFVHPEAPLLN